jgi:amino-acid racemase
VEHLGILAHSIEGAALCLRAFGERGSAALGPYQHPDVTLDCIAFGRSMDAWEAGDHQAVRAILAESVRRLRGAGASFFVCADNTAHLALREPGDDLALPGLHIAQVLAWQAHRDHRRQVGILGTRYLMDSDLYPAALAGYGIGALAPDERERTIVDTIIFEQLVNGVFTDEARAAYVTIIQHLRQRGCDAIALACTEIPLLVTEQASPLPTLDSTRLLAAAAFDVCVGSLAFPDWRGGRRDWAAAGRSGQPDGAAADRGGR